MQSRIWSRPKYPFDEDIYPNSLKLTLERKIQQELLAETFHSCLADVPKGCYSIILFTNQLSQRKSCVCALRSERIWESKQSNPNIPLLRNNMRKAGLLFPRVFFFSFSLFFSKPVVAQEAQYASRGLCPVVACPATTVKVAACCSVWRGPNCYIH